MNVHNNDMSQKVPLIFSIIGAIFNAPRVALNPFLGVFKPLDLAILEELYKHLDKESSEITKLQCSEINLVQCVTAKTSELNLFKLSWKGTTLERSRYYINDSKEYVLAEMIFTTDKKNKIKVKIFVVEGVLFSLDFDSDIRNLRETKIIDVIEFLQH